MHVSIGDFCKYVHYNYLHFLVALFNERALLGV